MERSKRESLNLRMRHGDDRDMEWDSDLSPGAHLSHSVMCKESNEDDTKETLQTNKQKALTSLQVLFSWVCTCFRFASTLNMLLCLLFCFVSLIQSSSVCPRIYFSPVCEFLLIPCNYSQCENGSFEVLSLHSWQVFRRNRVILNQWTQRNDRSFEWFSKTSLVWCFPIR